MIVNFEDLLTANSQIEFNQLDGQYYPEYESTKKAFKLFYPEAKISTEIVTETKNGNKLFETVITNNRGEVISRGYFVQSKLKNELDELDNYVYDNRCKESELNAFKNLGFGIPYLNSFKDYEGIIKAEKFNPESGEIEEKQYAAFDADQLRKYFFTKISGGSIIPEFTQDEEGNFNFNVQYLKNGKILAEEKSENWINIDKETLDKNALNIIYEKGFNNLELDLPNPDGILDLNNKSYTEIVNKAESLGFFIANKNRSDISKDGIEDIDGKTFSENYIQKLNDKFRQEKLEHDKKLKELETEEKQNQKTANEKAQLLHKEAGSIAANMIKLPCGGYIATINKDQKDKLTVLRGLLNNVKGIRIYTTMAEYAAELGIKGNQLTAQNIDDLIKRNTEALCEQVKMYPNFFNNSSFHTVKGYPLENQNNVKEINNLIAESMLSLGMGGNFKMNMDMKGKKFIMKYVKPGKEQELKL